MITAQACTQSCLTFHSILSALSIISLYALLVLYASLNSTESSSAQANFVPGFSGISFTNSFISAKFIQNTLHTSFTAALAANVPKVDIFTTLSAPYLSLQYFITLSLSVSAKSVSISGIDILAGFKNLSKRRSYSSGSISVIPERYAIKEPAADPLPGHTGIS